MRDTHGTPVFAARADASQQSPPSGPFDLIGSARKHRYRVRNLHDGDPVPPARRTRPKGDSPAAQAGFIGKEDRYDAIVGYDGYVTDEGNGQLRIYLEYRSAKGVNRAEARIRALGGTVTQVGDTEIAGTIPVERIEEALKLIRVSKVPMRTPNPTFKAV